MKDQAKESYGNLEELKKLGEVKKNPYTVEQLLDFKLKNIDGESNEEVRKRMLECVNEILNKYVGQRIVIVSHGAAIKYFLQNWCEYVYEKDALYREGNFICPRTLSAPSVLKLEFEDDNLVNMNVLE